MPDDKGLVVVGLDLSLTATGVAIVDRDILSPEEGVRQSLTIKSKGARVDSLEARNLRLEHMSFLIQKHSSRATSVAIEGPSHGSTSGNHHDRSGLWWMVANRLLRDGVRVYEVAPTQVKKYATGKGNASKAEVMIAAVKRYPQFDITNDNEADAVILAAFLARALGHPIEDSLPQTHLAALDKFRPNPGTER